MKVINPPSGFEEVSVETIVASPSGPAAEPSPSAPPECPWTFADYQRVLQGTGEGGGTVCLPMASGAEVPSPQDWMSSPDEVRQAWDQVVKDSSKRVTQQVGSEAVRCAKDKKKDIAALLAAALQSGNIDLAMLLVSGLETRATNEIAGGLLTRIQQLQDQRKAAADQMSQLGKTDDDAKKVQSLNIEVGNIGTEIQTIQTFLQDVMSQKSEAQQMASNFLKQRHETAMGIIRNTG